MSLILYQQENSSQEMTEQECLLEESTKALSNKESELAQVLSNYEEEKSKSLLLQLEVDRLKEELDSEKMLKKNINIDLEKERTEKDSALIRTALISQEIQIAKQETKKQELENVELQTQLDNLEKMLKNKSKDITEITKRLDEALQRIGDFEKVKLDTETLEGNEKVLKTSLSDLEEQLNEKNKVFNLNT